MSSKESRTPIVTKARLVSGFLGVVTVFCGWYFPHCYEERKDVISEVRNAFADRRAAQDQMIETMDASLKETYGFMDYLASPEIFDLQIVQHHLSEIGSLYQTGYAECNKMIQAVNRQSDAEASLAQLFLVSDSMKISKKDGKVCSTWRNNLFELTSISPPQLNSEVVRQHYIARFAQYRPLFESAVRDGSRDCESCARRMEEELKYAESRRFSLSITCLDCLKRLFTRF